MTEVVDYGAMVALAQQGDKDNLTALIRAIQGDIFNMAMRMLVNPEDAEDATQEILILIVTKLSTFEGRCLFRTWMYRVAMNHLLTNKNIKSKEAGLTFEIFQSDLEDGLVEDSNTTSEKHV